MIRTRFAPSPTGFLHVGGLRTALYSYLVAKKAGGQFLLRIEDTDQSRLVESSVIDILKSLYWGGVIPDEGAKLSAAGAIVQEGTHGPYIQSERLTIYKKHADELLAAGKAYYCFCSPERLTELRATQEKNKQPTGYDGQCLGIDPAEAAKRVAAGEKAPLRIKMPKTGTTEVVDLIRGTVTFKNDLQEDFVGMKSDGFPTYHLASVIDDHDMQISHVIRGEEWLSSVPKHIQLYKHFGWEAPQFAHLSLLLNPDKSKLSKRQGDVAASDYEKKGYLPEALLNFVAFLGWNPGTEKELYTLDELVQDFSLEKVSKAGAVFNLEKLDWYNKEYLKKLSPTDLVSRAWPWLKEAKLVTDEQVNDAKFVAWLGGALTLERERVATLAELPEAIGFVIALPNYLPTALVWKKGSKEEVQKILPLLKDFLNGITESDWNKTTLETKTKDWLVAQGFSVGSVLWPLRVALSGQEKSPGPFEIAEVLGKNESLNRLSIAIAKA